MIFRGDGGREELGEALRARGAHVDFVACYRRARPESGAAGLHEAFRDGRVDAVTITSSEGLDNLWALADDAHARRVAPLPDLRSACRASPSMRASWAFPSSKPPAATPASSRGC